MQNLDPLTPNDPDLAPAAHPQPAVRSIEFTMAVAVTAVLPERATFRHVHPERLARESCGV